MRILILSDLHLEFGNPYSPPSPDLYDTVVLAGDIHRPGTRGIQWARDTFSGKPVVYVPGNHEFYGQEMGAQLQAMRDAAAGSNVHVLDCDRIAIEGVLFLGAILWTDFALTIVQQDGSRASDVGRALATARMRLNDFREISVRTRVPWSRGQRQDLTADFPLTPEDTLAMHAVARDWIDRQLHRQFAGPTVVVTHHAPAQGSVAQRYAGDWLTPAFVSELPSGMFGVAQLWIHGHTHTALDYGQLGTRVVSNPRGYREQDSSFENHLFNGAMIIDVVGVASGFTIRRSHAWHDCDGGRRGN